MGINCSKLKNKDTPPSAICNFNNLNKNSVPFLNQATYTLDARQNFSEGNKELEIVNSKTINLKIFHQNIRGLRNKIDELIMHLSDCVPQVLCFTVHHLKEFEINLLNAELNPICHLLALLGGATIVVVSRLRVNNTRINCYNLGAFYCRKTRKLGGVGKFVHDTLSCTPIDLTEYCHEQDLEACALKFKVLNNVFCILCIYRPPTGNFGTFIHLLESLLNYTQIPLM